MKHSTAPRVAITICTMLGCAGPAAALQHAAESVRITLQDTAAPSQPVREKVSIRSGSALLVGDLLIPPGGGRRPTIVLIAGSRNSTFLPGIAEHLVANGLVVLDLHKRGVGGSSGRWDRQDFVGRAVDVEAALDYLHSRHEVDPSTVGVMGHSQGGWIAQMVAARRPDVAFVVLLAAPGQGVRDQILADERIHLERRGLPPDQIARNVASLERKLGVLSATAPLCRKLRAHYLCHIIRFDPAPYLERISSPVLAIYGELDPMAPPAIDTALVAKRIRSGGNGEVTIHVLPQANHMFWPAHTGLRDEYHGLKREYVPGFPGMIGEWITNRFIMMRDSAVSLDVRNAASPDHGSADPDTATAQQDTARGFSSRAASRRRNRVSIGRAVTRLAHQDVVHTPFVHRTVTPFAFTAAYRRSGDWPQFVEARFDVGSSQLARYPIDMHDHDNLAHSYVLTDVAYGIGRRLGPSDAITAGLAFDVAVYAASYGYGVEENFGYVMHPGLNAWFAREVRFGSRQTVTARASVPLVSWLARSPWMVNDDGFIENVDADSPVPIALNFLRDGHLVSWRERQGLAISAEHELALGTRIGIGSSWRFSLLRAATPRPFTALRHSLGVHLSFGY